MAQDLDFGEFNSPNYWTTPWSESRKFHEKTLLQVILAWTNHIPWSPLLHYNEKYLYIKFPELSC